MTKKIILCADDFGENTSINNAIFMLAKHQRINATSCLVNCSAWNKNQAEQLAQHQELYIGLHLNFTQGDALSVPWQQTYGKRFSTLFSLMSKCYFRKLSNQIIEAEICSQMNAFIAAFGKPPDFIDGHQHCHQLPKIREVLLQYIQKNNLNLFCRNTYNNWQDIFAFSTFPKRQAISLLGGFAFKRQLRQNACAYNNSFSGIYSFKNSHYYRDYFKQFLQEISSGGLIMCHPAFLSNNKGESFRQHEFNYLIGDAFLSDLNEAQCELVTR